MKANVHQTFDYASIGLRIKSARNKAGMTQDQFAEKLHISRRHVSLLENGERGISLELLVQVSDVLSIPVTEHLKPPPTCPADA